ncbi:MAG TPA: hypothetical protein VMT85_05755 [Thermoanaerobaculia bacterium]|nr:hypothetical protein [Thermoanaerobaculia bacterium]
MERTMERTAVGEGTRGLERWWRAAALLLVAVLACALYLSLEQAASGGLGLPLDDGWIHLTFARSLAAGDGMSYQSDRWVSGSTAPLWTAILSLGFLLPGEPLHWSKGIGVVCYLLAVLAMVRLAAAFGVRRPFSWLAGLLLVLTDWMVWSALSGMEIPLFVLLTTVGLELQAREVRAGGTRHWALPVFGLAMLVRPEGALLLALAALERSVRIDARDGTPGLASSLRRVRGLLPALGVAILSCLPFAVFSLMAGGSALPTTFEAKLESGYKWLPALRDLWMAAEVLFRPQPWTFLLAGAGAAALLRRCGRAPQSLLPLLWLLSLPCAYSLLAPAGRPMPMGNFGRYLFPLYPSLIVLGVLGMQSLGPVIWRSWRWRGGRLPVPLLACAIVLLPSTLATLAGAPRHARNVANVEQSDVLAGRWIAANLPAGAVLGVQDVGAIGYFAPNPILDLVGIVTPEILSGSTGEEAPPARDMGWLAARVRARNVDYLVVFPASYGGEEVLGRYLPGLRALRRFPVRENVTMAGSELVVYALAPTE